MIDFLKKQRAASLLGLSFDGNRLEGVVLRRTNGALAIQKTFEASLSLDPLTNDPELVGQEIRNKLEESGIRERRCAVSIPLNWALTLETKVPDMPEADVNSFLQIEAERGFPYGPDALLISSSRYRSSAGEQYATQVAVPKDHLARLGKALKAARLKPVTFSLGIAALQSPQKDSSDGVLALAVGENSVSLQITCGSGVAALRTLEGVLETESGQKRFNADVIAREIRITLGQLPAELRDTVRHLRVFGQGEPAQQLAEELPLRVDSMGMNVKRVTSYSADEFSAQLPPAARVSAALSLAARHLVGDRGFEFLPPKSHPWQQFGARYSSKKLVWAGAAAGSLALIIGAAFLIQQWQLSRLRSRWAAIAPNVTELENLQQQIRKFRPWFDDSLSCLNILRRLTESFPEDGVVSAKTVEIRELTAVTCSGTARDSNALSKMEDKLSATKGVTEVHIERRGLSPLQFTCNFHWDERGSNEH
jgi:hypothetical protein